MQRSLIVAGVIAIVIAASGSVLIHRSRLAERSREAEQHRSEEEKRVLSAQSAERQRQYDEAQAQKQKDEEKRVAQAARSQAEENDGLVLMRANLSYNDTVRDITKRHFEVTHNGTGVQLVQSVFESIPKQLDVNEVSLFSALQAANSRSSQADLSVLRKRFAGQYLLLGNGFQIQPDANFPQSGKEDFALFGRVELDGITYVNLLAHSDEPMPPYAHVLMLIRILDFEQSTNRGGVSVVVPDVSVILAATAYPLADEAGDVIVGDARTAAMFLSSLGHD